MKARRLYLAGLLLTALLPLRSTVGQPLAVQALSVDSLGARGYALATSPAWRLRAGDDLSWAQPAVDDRQWETCSPGTKAKGLPLPKFAGICWYRLWLRADSTLWSLPLALTCLQVGACEVFLDGRLVAGSGRIGADADSDITTIDRNPRPLVVSPSPVHLLAVRYACRGLAWQAASDDETGLVLLLDRLDQALARRVHETGYRRWLQQFPAGAFLAFAFVHLLMYRLYPGLKRNLHFGVAALLSAALVYLDFEPYFARDARHLLVQAWAWRLAVVGAALAGLRVYYGLLYSKLPRPFYAFAAAGAAAAVVSLLWLDLLFVVYLFVLLVGVEGVRLAILAFTSRRRIVVRIVRGRLGWALGVAIGMVLTIGTVTYQVLANLGYVNPPSLPHLYLAGLLFFVLPMSSAYLFRDFAQTHRDLERRLVQVRRLGEQALEQERRSREESLLRQRLQAENQRKTEQLEEARRLQQSMLPRQIPVHPYLEIAWYMKTATEVGGDYYDYDLAEDGTLTLALGDATGHGLQAGIVVTATKSLFLTMAAQPAITEILTAISCGLRGMHLTRLGMAMAILKIKDHRLSIASAGMPPALIHRRDSGRLDELEIPGLPLGSPLACLYQQQEVELHPGDTILLMSDGFPERCNPADEELGYHRAQAHFVECAALAPEEICRRLAEAGEAWACGRPQDDDITFVVLKVN